jgi:hypothetical protein
VPVYSLQRDQQTNKWGRTLVQIPTESELQQGAVLVADGEFPAIVLVSTVHTEEDIGEACDGLIVSYLYGAAATRLQRCQSGM